MLSALSCLASQAEPRWQTAQRLERNVNEVLQQLQQVEHAIEVHNLERERVSNSPPVKTTNKGHATLNDIEQGVVALVLAVAVYGGSKNGKATSADELCSSASWSGHAKAVKICKDTLGALSNEVDLELVNADPDHGGFGFYATSSAGLPALPSTTKVLAFAGTDDMSDVGADISSISSVEIFLGPKKLKFGAGAGFVKEYKQFLHGAPDRNKKWQRLYGGDAKKYCKGNPRVLVTGHSLGGALANIAAVDLYLSGCEVDLITFGAPRTFPSVRGTKEWLGLGGELYHGMQAIQFLLVMKHLLGSRFTATRIVNEGDPVPAMPYAYFSHMSDKVITTGNADGTKTVFRYKARDYHPHIWASGVYEHSIANYAKRLAEGLSMCAEGQCP